MKSYIIIILIILFIVGIALFWAYSIDTGFGKAIAKGITSLTLSPIPTATNKTLPSITSQQTSSSTSSSNTSQPTITSSST